MTSFSPAVMSQTSFFFPLPVRRSGRGSEKDACAPERHNARERFVCTRCKYWCQTQRAHRSPARRTTQERAIMCIAPSTKARRPACLTTASYLAALCLPFFNSQHRSQAYAVYIYVSLVLSTAVTPPPLPSPLIISCFSLLVSLHALLPVPSRHIGLRKGNLALPGSRRTGAPPHTVSRFETLFFFFFLTNKARAPRCGMRSRFRT